MAFVCVPFEEKITSSDQGATAQKAEFAKAEIESRTTSSDLARRL